MVQIGASLERTGVSFGNSVSRWFLKGNSSAACRNDSGHRHGKSNCFKDWIVGYLTHFWFINSFNSCYNNNNSTAFSLWVNLPVEHLQVLPPSSALKKCHFHRCLKHCLFSTLMTMFHSTWPVLFLWSLGESFSHNYPKEDGVHSLGLMIGDKFPMDFQVLTSSGNVKSKEIQERTIATWAKSAWRHWNHSKVHNLPSCAHECIQCVYFRSIRYMCVSDIWIYILCITSLHLRYLCIIVL